MNLTDPNTTFAAFYCLTVTGVGTPLFAAPEVMVGEVYDESVDVYSFAILLLAMAVETDLPEWFEQRYKTFQEKKKRKKLKRPPKIMRVLRAVWEDGWRPYDHDDEEDDNDEEDKASSEDLEQQQQSREGGGGSGPLFFVPPSIRSLIVRCGSHDPKARPTFEQIMEELEGPVVAEVVRGYAPFSKYPHRRLPFKRRDEHHIEALPQGTLRQGEGISSSPSFLQNASLPSSSLHFGEEGEMSEMALDSLIGSGFRQSDDEEDEYPEAMFRSVTNRASEAEAGVRENPFSWPQHEDRGRDDLRPSIDARASTITCDYRGSMDEGGGRESMDVLRPSMTRAASSDLRRLKQRQRQQRNLRDSTEVVGAKRNARRLTALYLGDPENPTTKAGTNAGMEL